MHWTHPAFGRRIALPGVRGLGIRFGVWRGATGQRKANSGKWQDKHFHGISLHPVPNYRVKRKIAPIRSAVSIVNRLEKEEIKRWQVYK